MINTYKIEYDRVIIKLFSAITKIPDKVLREPQKYEMCKINFVHTCTFSGSIIFS